MCRVLLSVAVLLLSTTSASAASFAASDVLQIFNFDLTSLSPGPPFERIVFPVSAGVASGTTTAQFFGYPDLNGGGVASLLFSTNIVSGGTTHGGNAIAFTGFTDGLFSVGVVGTAPGVTFQAGLEAFGRFDDGSITQRVDPVASSAVPEPASLLLFGTGLVLAGSRRFRRRK